MTNSVLELLDSEDKRRYIATHAPSILCALIVRRASSEPAMLIEQAIETAALLHDQVMPPGRRNGRVDHELEEKNGTRQ